MLKNILEDYIKEFDLKLKIISNEKYIPYEYLTRALSLFYTYKQEIYKVENIDLTKQLSDRLLDILTNLEFKGHRGILMDGQKTYNAVGIFEDALISKYNNILTCLGGNAYDHDHMHTGPGFGIPDFEVKEAFKLDRADGLTISLSKGLKIDAKTYMTEEKMEEALDQNFYGDLGHHGDYLLIYILSTGKYYFAPNGRFKALELKPLDIEFTKPFVKLFINEDGLLIVGHYEFNF